MDPSNTPHQGMVAANSLEEVLASSTSTKAQQDKKMMRPQEESLKCPRCDSTNTKFCYYNNYSLSQPRYFCKGCKRYWTQGGTLRNVPVGGGCRKNSKRSSRPSSSSSSSSTSSSSNIPNLPHFTYDSHNDLTLAFARLHNPTTMQLGFNDQHNPVYGNYLSTTTAPYADNFQLLDTQGNATQNVYNRFGNEHLGEVLNGSGDGEEAALCYEEMNRATTTTATTMTTTKQDVCSSDGGIINKGYWNFPWHIGAEAGLGLAGVDSGKEYWNGLGPSWHGLINSPLM